MKQRRTERAGLTLIELLIVVVIIGILAGILFKLGSLIGNRDAQSETVARLENLKNCIETYNTIYGMYPPVSGVTWEKPGASAMPPNDWGIIQGKAQQGDSCWENASKECGWDALYPYLAEDAYKSHWSEFAAGAGMGSDGLKGYTNVNSQAIGGGFEYGLFDYSNNVYSIKDGWGHEFVYVGHGPDYASYTLYSKGPDGNAGTEDDVGDTWNE